MTWENINKLWNDRPQRPKPTTERELTKLCQQRDDLLAACETGWHETRLNGPQLLRQAAALLELHYPGMADTLRNKADLEAEAIAKAKGEI
jgi:hypothetical protein